MKSTGQGIPIIPSRSTAGVIRRWFSVGPMTGAFCVSTFRRKDCKARSQPPNSARFLFLDPRVECHAGEAGARGDRRAALIREAGRRGTPDRLSSPLAGGAQLAERQPFKLNARSCQVGARYSPKSQGDEWYSG